MYSTTGSSISPTRHFPRTGSFADLLVRYVRDYVGGAPAAYAAAGVDRRTYSAIVSNPFRPVSKQTALRFALGLHLDRNQADELLQAAGFALSPAIPVDVFYAEAIEDRRYSVVDVESRIQQYVDASSSGKN